MRSRVPRCGSNALDQSEPGHAGGTRARSKSFLQAAGLLDAQFDAGRRARFSRATTR